MSLRYYDLKYYDYFKVGAILWLFETSPYPDWWEYLITDITLKNQEVIIQKVSKTIVSHHTERTLSETDIFRHNSTFFTQKQDVFIITVNWHSKVATVKINQYEEEEIDITPFTTKAIGQSLELEKRFPYPIDKMADLIRKNSQGKYSKHQLLEYFLFLYFYIKKSCQNTE